FASVQSVISICSARTMNEQLVFRGSAAPFMAFAPQMVSFGDNNPTCVYALLMEERKRYLSTHDQPRATAAVAPDYLLNIISGNTIAYTITISSLHVAT
ncbi:MAG: hypothetical protein KDE31_03800, partial [Caldilineaceae bacterium]|nr:hypothetical protein [Caldilineaceae bacterium]